MASAEREPITGAAGVQGAERLVGGQGRSPPEAECLFVFACPKEAVNVHHY